MKIALCLAVALITVGCDRTVGDFIKGASSAGPAAVINSPMALKVTPGRVRSVGSDVALEATVTPTNRTFVAGDDMTVSLTLSRSRVAPQ